MLQVRPCALSLGERKQEAAVACWTHEIQYFDYNKGEAFSYIDFERIASHTRR